MVPVRLKNTGTLLKYYLKYIIQKKSRSEFNTTDSDVHPTPPPIQFPALNQFKDQTKSALTEGRPCSLERRPCDTPYIFMVSLNSSFSNKTFGFLTYWLCTGEMELPGCLGIYCLGISSQLPWDEKGTWNSSLSLWLERKLMEISEVLAQLCLAIVPVELQNHSSFSLFLNAYLIWT